MKNLKTLTVIVSAVFPLWSPKNSSQSGGKINYIQKLSLSLQLPLFRMMLSLLVCSETSKPQHRTAAICRCNTYALPLFCLFVFFFTCNCEPCDFIVFCDSNFIVIIPSLERWTHLSIDVLYLMHKNNKKKAICMSLKGREVCVAVCVHAHTCEHSQPLMAHFFEGVWLLHLAFEW